ncbi:hypothetical protein IMZ11_29165 [Microtetraspora sp. AC03309]|uniref:hypothetical protein n=1 Tax=Microtetraspora sp. AC03309 TaxID=2779376 RepID=UPI001E5484CA|nr:hypothetical protein [Microtetraspora sp. AC03309]MCC5579705.1 hypothetical protein [Microtetraspora sp. AC03309]
MVEIAHLLDELTCAACGTSNALWLYPVWGVVECRECGEKASILLDPLDGFDSIDGPDSISPLDGFDVCGGGR